MDGSDGTGVVLTDHAVVLVAVYGGAVGSFILGLVAIMCGSTNEVAIARRAIVWARLACILACLAWFCVLHTELRRPRQRQLEWPHFGLLLPPLAVAITFVGVFVNSHPIFRWFTVLL